MKFSTEDIFNSVKGILEQHVGKVRNVVDSYHQKAGVSALNVSSALDIQRKEFQSQEMAKSWSHSDVMDEPLAKKVYTETSFMEQLSSSLTTPISSNHYNMSQVETKNATPASLSDLRFPTPSNTNKFLYLNQRNHLDSVSKPNQKEIQSKSSKTSVDELNTSLDIVKKKSNKHNEFRKNSSEMKTKITESSSKNVSTVDVEKKHPHVKKLPTPPRTASYESNASLSQEENTESLEDMIVSYINDNHFIQLVRLVFNIKSLISL